ncbi:hypothetical protein E2562_010018 [Oryza meyeriana var. granulata]|uniref:Myb-like domain-containing protein n=1 Tax=Oryza meyeriana var. granulata TaxID=110450 RepID=A0A6G1EK40_9ORYZ|nr:hypothetical protein E2562_010018 [Oryza meyeriana var. granulata]
MSFNPISPPPPPSAYGTGTPQAVNQGTSTNNTVNIDIDEDDNNGANRPVKKRYWSHEEEERLASAWLNASKDPVKGNDKKGDTFWKEVTDEFNNKGNEKRTREMNQLKIHWSRLKSSINDFNGYWTTVTNVNTSGYSDDMLEDEAQKMYAKKNGKPFSLVHWWKKLKDKPKWCAQFQETEKNKSEIVDVPDEQSRPIGREAAKAERSGKRKKENIMEGIVILGDNIEKIVKVQQDCKLEQEKVTEAQIQISNTNLKAAKEQKEAKMFEMSEEHGNSTSIDPLYSLDEFVAEDEILDDVISEAMVVIQSSIEGLQKEASDHRFHPRKHIKRPREEAHQKLVNDYFSESPLYPSNIFRRRFHMSRPLFLRIVKA